MHEGALSRPQINPALKLEHVESFANRPSTHSKPFCEIGLDEVFAGLVDPRDDQSLQLVPRALTKRWLPAKLLEGAVGRSLLGIRQLRASCSRLGQPDLPARS